MNRLRFNTHARRRRERNRQIRNMLVLARTSPALAIHAFALMFNLDKSSLPFTLYDYQQQALAEMQDA